jgi:hypothetical protein
MCSSEKMQAWRKELIPQKWMALTSEQKLMAIAFWVAIAR